MRILAIETSCDETAAAIVENGTKVLSNVIASQSQIHQITGGVVPEVAAREHIKVLPYIYKEALNKAGLSWADIDAIAATETPGLISSLLMGIQTARTLAKVHNKPYIGVNHIAGHVYSNWLDRKDDEFQFPIVTLTVSGGHNNLYLMHSVTEMELLGQTQDDAAGEAFDKVAKMLGLNYPGGPEIAKLATQGNENAFKLPIPHLQNPFDFSFSGLKTAVLYLIRDLDNQLSNETKADIAASFQFTATKALADSLLSAAKTFKAREIHLAGGVSANLRLRAQIEDSLSLAKSDLTLRYPNLIEYCTDNAAMIAAAGFRDITNKNR